MDVPALPACSGNLFARKDLRDEDTAIAGGRDPDTGRGPCSIQHVCPMSGRLEPTPDRDGRVVRLLIADKKILTDPRPTRDASRAVQYSFPIRIVVIEETFAGHTARVVSRDFSEAFVP